MNHKLYFILILFFISGCFFENNKLADTKWRLVEFVSMDDSTGKIRPQNQILYIMQLNKNGTFVMQLNCKQINGKWRAEISKDNISGSFNFTSVNPDKNICQKNDMEEQIIKHLKYVRGFIFKDEKLYLNLFADAGIYAWEPMD